MVVDWVTELDTGAEVLEREVGEELAGPVLLLDVDVGSSSSCRFKRSRESV